MRKLLLVPAFAAACLAVPALGDDGLRQVALTASRITAALGFTPLNPASNLSDVAAPSTARTNLGLGTAAVANTGTSGATVPLLNGANAWSGVNTFGTGAQFQDGGTLTLVNGIATEASAQLIDFGINDTRFGAGANTANPGGFLRFDGRAGTPFLTVFQKPAGTAAGASAAVNVFKLDAGVVGLPKVAAAPTAPSAGFGALFFVAGTNAGTCKLQAMAGTSSTPVTIADNIGSGC